MRENQGSVFEARLSRRKLLGLGAGVVALGGLSACGGDEKEPTTPGRLEGRVKFLNYEGWIGPDTVKLFQKAHPGVEIRQLAATSFPQALPKVKAQPGLYDMALASVDGIGRALRLGVLQPMDFSAIPNLRHVDKKYVDVSVNQSETFLVPTDYGKTGIGVRTDLVREDITSWADLWAVAPQYSGKIYWYDYAKDVLGAALLKIGASVNEKDEARIEEAGAELRRIKPHIGNLGTNGIGAALVSGDAAISVAYDYDIFSAQAENDKIAWIAPEEGLPAYLEGWVAFKGTPVQDEIQAFADFHLRPKNYAAFVEETSTAYVETGLEDLLPRSLASSEILFPPRDVVNRIEFQEFLGEAEPVYDRVYTEFKAA